MHDNHELSKHLTSNTSFSIVPACVKTATHQEPLQSHIQCSSDMKQVVNAGATYYFDIFARKYINSLGMEPKPAKKVE